MVLKRRGFTLITPLVVANNFLVRGKEEDIEITPLKLQKLVYFLYATYLKATNEKLFSEQFEVWTKGPVVPSIYTSFSSYGDNPIKTFAKDSQDKVFYVDEIGIYKRCLDTVWGKYKNLTGEELSKRTHEPGTAWTKAKNQSSPYLDDQEIINDGTEIA